MVFLSQMIPHHQDAIDMAMLVPDRAAHQELKDLAKSITQSQGDEITKMNGWLGSWYSLEVRPGRTVLTALPGNLHRRRRRAVHSGDRQALGSPGR